MIRVYNEIANQVIKACLNVLSIVFLLYLTYFRGSPTVTRFFSFLYALHMLFVFGAVLVRQLVNVRKSLGKD